MSAGPPLSLHVRRAPRVVAAVLFFAAAITACFPLPQPPAGTYAPTPAVFGMDMPDPFVVNAGAGYSVFATNSQDDWLKHVPSATSATLSTWAAGPDALARVPDWNDPAASFRYWAPAVHHFGATWVMYFTAPEVGTGRQCIGIATATAPNGPYTPLANSAATADAGPIVCDIDGGSIDPSVVIDQSNTPWILWKNDGNCCAGLTADIWSQQLASDGLGLEPSSNKNHLLDVTQAWEVGGNSTQRIVEGPTMAFKNGTYWLFYSANWWESINSAVGYAKCASPTGPCTKPRNGPILKSGTYGLGPGGPEVFTDAGGQLWLAYHAWPFNKVTYSSGGKRTLRLSRLSLDGPEPVLGAGP